MASGSARVGVVYFIEAPNGSRCCPVKIGHTDGDPRERLRALQTGSPVRLELVGGMIGTPADERRLHRQFGDLRMHGEWFRKGLSLAKFIEANVRRDVDLLLAAVAESRQLRATLAEDRARWEAMSPRRREIEASKADVAHEEAMRALAIIERYRAG